MIQRIARILIVITLVLALVIPPPSALACGPYFPVTIFIQTKHPDIPLEKFAAGELGVLQPTYSRSYLVVAYRYFSGGTFDSSEQEQLLALWAHRLDREGYWLKGKKKNAYQVWLEARYLYATGSRPAPTRDDENDSPGYGPSSSGYYQFQNCADDAYLTAAKTLATRSKQFGQRSDELRSWLNAQDTVFNNCGGSLGSNGGPALPDEAPQQLPAVLRADRSYQIAAAYFYSQDWTEAEQRFQTIAQDSSSPWQSIAAIVAVRTKLRKITLSEDPPESHKNDFAAIDAELRNLEKMPSMKDLRPAIWRMRGFVEFRLDPNARRIELADIIEHAKHRSTLREDLDDYTQLLDRAVDDDPDEEASTGPRVPVTRSYKKFAAVRSLSSMTDWLLTFQAADETATARALVKWKESRSLPWLVAALSKASPQTPNLPDLLDAAAQIQPNSPAYLTVSFHRARLQAESGDSDAARQTIENALSASSAKTLPSALNLFLSLRTKLARNLDEFLQSAQRRPGVVTDDMDNRDLPDPVESCDYSDAETKAACVARFSPPPMFDADAAAILTEGVPTRTLALAASNSRLPENLRLQLVESAWVRAILLNDDDVARQLVPLLSSLSPDLASGTKIYLESDSSSRRFAAVFLILHRPELHPYISVGVGRQTLPGHMNSYHDNWWCSLADQDKQDGWRGNYYSIYRNIDGPLLTVYSDKKLDHPSFLTEAEIKTTEKEWSALTKLDTAPNWFASEVFAFAKANPNDPRVPEALHYVVRATHLGCTDPETKRYSKSAFQLLHKRYPARPWTEKTPYWY